MRGWHGMESSRVEERRGMKIAWGGAEYDTDRGLNGERVVQEAKTAEDVVRNVRLYVSFYI